MPFAHEIVRQTTLGAVAHSTEEPSYKKAVFQHVTMSGQPRDRL